jgi:hypothetical protein
LQSDGLRLNWELTSAVMLALVLPVFCATTKLPEGRISIPKSRKLPVVATITQNKFQAFAKLFMRHDVSKAYTFCIENELVRGMQVAAALQITLIFCGMQLAVYQKAYS